MDAWWGREDLACSLVKCSTEKTCAGRSDTSVLIQDDCRESSLNEITTREKREERRVDLSLPHSAIRSELREESRIQ